TFGTPDTFYLFAFSHYTKATTSRSLFSEQYFDCTLRKSRGAASSSSSSSEAACINHLFLLHRYLAVMISHRGRATLMRLLHSDG
ncbi:uncharacterized, partial [Tachysurus ichikawai]